MLKRLLAVAISAALGTTAMALVPNGSMPDIAKTYHHRSNCHGAYDLLIQDHNAGRAVSAEDRAFGKAYEDAAANGAKCPKPSEALLGRAIDHVVETDDGLSKLAAFHKQKDPVAYFEAALSVITGKTKIVGADVGYQLLNQANILGDPDANFFSATLYIAGKVGGKVNYEEALKHMEAAAAEGHVDAIFQAGNFYAAGLGTKKNPKKAFAYYGQAAERGHVAGAWLAAQMATGDEGVKTDPALGYRLARNLVDQGEVVGAILAASALLQMKDNKKHEDEVLYWLDMAIRDGDASIKEQVSQMRPRIVAAFKRANAPPEYTPRRRKICPKKTVCRVDRFTGVQDCTTNTDYWNDCDTGLGN